MRNNNSNIVKGMLAGLAAGFVASWTMNQFQAAWTRMAGNGEKPHGAQAMQPVQGSTGYEFIAAQVPVLLDQAGFLSMRRAYGAIAGEQPSVADKMREAKLFLEDYAI